MFLGFLHITGIRTGQNLPLGTTVLIHVFRSMNLSTLIVKAIFLEKNVCMLQ
jgi:hypothetical protein